MKHFLFFLGSNLLLTGLAHAQLGVRVGTNLLNITPEYSAGARSSTSNQLGYQAGIFYQQPLTQHLSLVPEVQFSHEQTQVDFEYYHNEENYTRSNYDLDFSYVNVPVLLRYTLGRVHFEAGPQASWLVGGRGSGHINSLIGGDGRAASDIHQAATERFQKFSLGACVGIGVSLPAGLGLDVRAYQGITSINQDNSYHNYSDIPYWDGAIRRQNIQASLTYQLASNYKLAVIKL